MGQLKLMKADGGGIRPTWYARFTRCGQKVNVNLGVAVRGNPPPMIKDEDGKDRFNLAALGDADFEKSRAAALKALEKMQAVAKRTGDAPEVKRAKDAAIAARFHRARTGKSVKGVKIEKLPALWASQKRSYTPTEDWQAAVKTWFERFAKFAEDQAVKRGARCVYVNEITPEIATAWFDDIKGKFAWETVCKMMSLMRNAYARYATRAEHNPFADIIMRNRETANARKPHKPLIGAELERLFDCAREDESVYDLIVTAACTGMRIGDVCNLKLEDVDLQSGLIDVVTAKAGVKATIPIFGRLREVLTKRAALSADGEKPSAFVFPAAAAQYNPRPMLDKDGNPVLDESGSPKMTDGRSEIYKAAKPYFARAVFGDADETKPAEVDADGNVIPPPALEDVIDGAKFTEAKRSRLLEVNRRFRKGEKSNMIAEALGVGRSVVSMDLREIGKLTGEELRPRATAGAKRKSTLDLIEKTREKRGIGQRAASVYGYHSLRSTFVVLAAEAGIPLADIALVVGHTTTDTTMQYFHPERKHAAERVRRKLKGSVLDGNTPAEIPAPAQTAVAKAAPSVDDVIAALTDEQKKALARKLLGL